MATTKINHADREALEARAIQGYRSGELTHYQDSRLLGMTRFEFESFLRASCKDRQVYDHAYDCEDFEEDLRTLEELERKGPPR